MFRLERGHGFSRFKTIPNTSISISRDSSQEHRIRQCLIEKYRFTRRFLVRRDVKRITQRGNGNWKRHA